jgi:AAA domain, putative AbiEii toxin, Type IV TA system
VPPVQYVVRVEDHDGNPFVANENLITLTEGGRTEHVFVSTRDSAHRVLFPESGGELEFQEPDRLSLAWVAGAGPTSDSPISFLPDFWERAVFLRLSPNRLAYGSPAKRKSFEPLLDEEGQTLPALLNELDEDQRRELVQNLRQVISGMRDIEVSKAEIGRDTRVHYSLLERMPYRGRSGRYQFPIPAWMLSEGTRRVTAILALLVREPPPSLLCIEEIENGLDPWTVRIILRHLQSAADRGTQIILTTHSPWLLDHVPMDTIIQVRRVEGDTKHEHFASRPEIREYDDSIPAGTRYVNEAE